MFVPQAFTFENIDDEGRALCLGETVILQEEINPFLSRLRELDIIVTAVHNHWLFDNPRLFYMHFEAIERPLTFARKLSEAMEVLITRKVRFDLHLKDDDFHVPNSYSSFRKDLLDLSDYDYRSRRHSRDSEELCDEFSDILGGTMHTFENGQCIVTRSRLNIKPIVLGRSGRSFLLIPQMFAFESMSRDGRALCSGETVILQDEINPFISKLREHDIIVTAVHNHWLFESPRLMFMHWESIDRPLAFARKVRDALSVLTTRNVSQETNV